MKQILVFLTLIGLLLVNLKLNAQVEYYNEKNPRPEEVTLHPTMKNAHKGTNFSANEVRLAHLKGLNSYVPIDVQNTFTIEKVRTMFSYYQPDVKDIDAWIVQNTNLGQDQNSWSEKTFSYLVSGPTPTTTILSGGYQSQKASGSQIGPKMIERMPYKRGDRGYTEDEQFLYLDLGKVCYLPEYQGVLVLWISLGCGNHVFPYTPPSLVITQQVVQTQPVVEPQRAWGSDWVVSIEYYTIQQPIVQMPPQNFNYCGMSYQWGIGYTPCCGWSPAIYYPMNCCVSYIPQQPVVNNYYEGDTYITNEGDQIVINEGDIINNNNVINNPNPNVETPDDGRPVDGNTGGGPADGNTGSTTGTATGGSGTGGGPADGNTGTTVVGGDGVNTGMTTTNQSDLNQTQKQVSFSDISPKVQSEAEYWNSAKQSLIQKDDALVQTQTTKQPGNWTVQNTESVRNPETGTNTKPVQTEQVPQASSPSRENGLDGTNSTVTQTTKQPGNWNPRTPTTAEVTPQSEVKQPVETSSSTGRGNGNITSNQGTTTSSSDIYMSRGNENYGKPANWNPVTPTNTPVRGDGVSSNTGNNPPASSVPQPFQGKPVNWDATANTNPAVSGGKNPGTTARPQTTGTTTAPVRGNGTSSTTYKPSQNTTVQRGNGGTNTSSTSGKLNTGNYQTSNNSGTTSQGSSVMKGSNNYSGGKMSGGNTGGMRSSGGGSRGSGGGGSRGGRR